LRAAVDFGRDAIGIDIVEEYIKMSRERLAQQTLFTENMFTQEKTNIIQENFLERT